MGQGTEMGHKWDRSRTELGQNEDSGQKWDKSRDTDIVNQHPADLTKYLQPET